MITRPITAMPVSPYQSHLTSDIYILGSGVEEIILWDSKTCSDLLSYHYYLLNIRLTTTYARPCLFMGTAHVGLITNLVTILEIRILKMSSRKEGIGYRTSQIELGGRHHFMVWKKSRGRCAVVTAEGLNAVVDKKEESFSVRLREL